MTALANTVQFFGSFSFMTPAEIGRSLRYLLSLSFLPSGLSRGTGRAYRGIVLDKTENVNTQNGALPVISAVSFRAEVLDSKQPILVGFSTPWSRACQVMDSVLQELAGACLGKVKVVKVNADDSLDLSLCYDIQSVPTLLYFVGGNPCVRIVGTASKEAILAKLNPFFQ